jgi:F0F1-type ATP synthase membrane subunit b/b'
MNENWPEAAIAIAGIAFVFGLIMVVVWQVLATWRSRMMVAREEAYRKLAEQATEAQSRTAAAMEQAAAELTRIREETAEMRRLLREVE